MTVYEIAGFFGVILYLGAYLALQLGAIKGSGFPYATINMIAAAFILLSLTVNFNLWSAITQTAWILISIVGMTLYYLRTRSIKYTPAEQSLVDAKLFQMSPLDARKFLSAGTWWEGEAGDEIAQQGHVIGKLHYLASGSARVELDGREIGQVNARNFVGELSCFSGAPASADVVLSDTSQIFSIETDSLNALCARNPDLRLQLEISVKLDTHTKLLAANKIMRALEGADG